MRGDAERQIQHEGGCREANTARGGCREANTARGGMLRGQYSTRGVLIQYSYIAK